MPVTVGRFGKVPAVKKALAKVKPRKRRVIAGRPGLVKPGGGLVKPGRPGKPRPVQRRRRGVRRPVR